jgi:hypothetical protein
LRGAETSSDFGETDSVDGGAVCVGAASVGAACVGVVWPSGVAGATGAAVAGFDFLYGSQFIQLLSSCAPLLAAAMTNSVKKANAVIVFFRVFIFRGLSLVGSVDMDSNSGQKASPAIFNDDAQSAPQLKLFAMDNF